MTDSDEITLIETPIASEASKLRVAVLPLKDWPLEDCNGKPTISPIKGTWCLVPANQVTTVRSSGIVSCPNCGEPALVPPQAIECDAESRWQLPAYQCRGCKFHGTLILQHWERRRLYCVAYEVQPPGGEVKGATEYLHAKDAGEALKYFWAGRRKDDYVLRVVGASVVIGYFVNDTKGDKLSV